MSEDAKQHENTEANDVGYSDESSLHQEESNSEYEELVVDDSEELPLDALEELVSSASSDDAPH